MSKTINHPSDEFEDDDAHESTDGTTYQAHIDYAGFDEKSPAECGDCDWEGPVGDLLEIVDCSLTPGDPSPAGRCPECETIAYVVKPEPPKRIVHIEVRGGVVTEVDSPDDIIVEIHDYDLPGGGDENLDIQGEEGDEYARIIHGE